ncbi:unnamed protein product [Sphagnum compactum]
MTQWVFTTQGMMFGKGKFLRNKGVIMARRSPVMNKKGRFSCCRLLTLVTIFGLASFLLLCSFISLQDYIPHVPNTSIYSHFLIPEELAVVEEEPILEEPILDVPALIEAIRQAKTKALGGETTQVEFSEDEKEEWQYKNPCRSRIELEPFYERRKFVRHLRPNTKWNAVLKEYSELHRTCIRKFGGDLTNIFLNRNNAHGCKFAVAGGPEWAGLGNKILPTVSVLLYAVLTQRVLLVTKGSLLADIMCEPFEGSSWRIDPDERFTPIESHYEFWNSYETLEEELDNITTHRAHERSSLYAVGVAGWCQPVKRFFCDQEQSFYTEVPWLYFTSCLYFLPKLFAIPMFQPVLEDLFPDRMVATHLVRSTMLPSDEVWSRVLRADHVYLETADRRVGIQIRYRNGETQFGQLHTMVNSKLMQCAWSHGILPDVNNNPNPIQLVESSTTTAGISPTENQVLHSKHSSSANSLQTSADSRQLRPPVTSIFITSLFSDLYDHLTQLYNRNLPPSGEHIGIIQLTHSNIQGTGVEEDIQALAEVMCLSFSDHLLVSPLSTFGGLAQAYGALTPWFLEFREDSNLPPCVRGHTVDPCYQDPEFAYFCPHDRSKFKLTRRNITVFVPYIHKCPSTDTPNGLQLITTPRLDI